MSGPLVRTMTGQLPGGRGFRLACSPIAVALWLAPVEIDGVTWGGGDDLIVVNNRPRTTQDAVDLSATLTALLGTCN